MRLICKILRTLLLTFVINGIFCDTWSIVTQRSQDFTINRQYLFIYIYFFNTVTLKATVNQCTLRAVRRHRYHPEFKQQLYTVPRYNYYSRLKYNILGHGSVKKRESRGNRSLTSTRITKRRRPSNT